MGEAAGLFWEDLTLLTAAAALCCASNSRVYATSTSGEQITFSISLYMMSEWGTVAVRGSSWIVCFYS